MAERKIGFLSADLNGNGKTGFFERMLGLDPGIRAVAGAWRGVTGRNQLGGWSPMKRQEFSTQNPWQVNDFTNSFGNMGNTGLSGGMGKTDPWSNPYKRQDFSLSAPQYPQMPAQPQDMFDPNALTQFTNTGLPMGNMPQAPRITPNKMPVRNDLDFMNTAGTAYQSRFAPTPTNAMTQNNGYFDMGKANTVGGNWVNGAGWRTDANKAFGQTEEDMAFNAQMAHRMGTMSQ